MAPIELRNIAKYYGGQEVLSNLNLTINPRQKTGLIGPNGSGKTTIIKLILRIEPPSEGHVKIDKNIKLGYVPQNPDFDGEESVFDNMLADFHTINRQLRKHEELLATASPNDLQKILNKYQAVRDTYDEMRGDVAVEKAETLLSSCGLEDRKNQTVKTLSGGEKNVLSLAKALMNHPDLLLLDEPGNHLDYIGLSWLEQLLVKYDGALLIVSHNRYLLDRIVSTIFELDAGKITPWEGNYSHYRLTRLQKLVAQQADFTANQKRLERLEDLVKRFEQIARSNSDPAWGRRLRARRTQLSKEREHAVEKPELNTSSIQLKIDSDSSRADIALKVRGYNKAFDDNVLFESADLSFSCGERVALVGPNGSGKTSFIKDIIEKGNWEHPVIRVGPSLKIGYCAQNQEIFSADKTIIEEFRELGAYNRHEVYVVLSRFLFGWEDLDKKISGLSGGELNRLQLARLIMLDANFLILDEPTNHLDIKAREAIEEGLEMFQGTILVVSHDRYFLDKIADTIVEIRDNRFEKFYGNFSEFWATLSHDVVRKTKKLSSKREKSANPPGKNAVQETGPVIRRIKELEKEKLSLEKAITESFEKNNYLKGRELAKKLDKLSRSLDRAYEEWSAVDND